MKSNPKLGLVASIIVLFGFPLFFMIVSIFTEDWRFLLWSLPPSFIAGFTGLRLSLTELKKVK